MIGRTISHYRIQSTLGRGGMGVVYKAEDVRLGRAVAVKFAPESMASDPVAVERFQREARTVSLLNHPNICTLFDVGENDGQPYLVMECLEGTTLRERINLGGLPVETLLDLSIQIAEALDAAHAGGVVHRDIKPANIFLTNRGQIKVMDFGLAKFTAASLGGADSQMATAALQNPITSTGTTLGTIAYMSPEQARGEELDARSDLFSFGVVLYEMATGVSPFVANSTALTFVAILSQEPVPVERLRADLPPELARILRKALEKNRDLRYQTAAEMRADLKRLRRDSDSGRSLTAATPRAPYVADKVKSNRRTVIAGLALAGLLAAAAGAWQLLREKPLDSLAVLPFENVGGDPANEYLSDGVTESIINSLSQLPQLSVRSFSSVQHLKKRTTGPQDAGKALKVRAILTGRLVKRGEEFAISAELIDVNGDRQIWGSRFTPSMNELQAIEEQIAREVAGKLQVQASGQDKKRMERQMSADTVAYQLYLQGRFQWNKRTLEGLQGSIDFFQQAIQKDPQYALAYAGQADAYALLADFNVLPTREVLPKVEGAAQKALQLDEGLAEAHTSLAWAKYHNWDWAGAGKEFQRAIALNASYVTAHAWYGEYLMLLGRFDESLHELTRATELNPMSPVPNLALGSRLFYARQFAPAVAQLQKTLAMDATFVPAHLYLGRAYVQSGQSAEGIAELKKALELSEGDSNELAALGQAYAAGKQEAEARKILAQLKERSQQTYVQPMGPGTIHLLLGEKDIGLDWLQKAFEDRSPGLLYIKVDPAYDAVRSDPRVQELMNRIGLNR